jgi:hypothetical protein
MRSFAILLLLCGACAHQVMSEEQARSQVTNLMQLHNEAQAKYVLQLQELQQDKPCHRASYLREVATKMLKEANMRPGDTRSLTVVHMELTQAEKKCLGR